MKATKMQRFLGYLIDIVLLSIIIRLCVNGFCNLVHFDTSNMTVLYENILVELEKYLDSVINSVAADTTALMNYIYEYIRYALVNFGFNALFSLIFVVLYLIVLPKFWKGQTLGRFIMKTKVVNKDGTDVRFSRILVRELVGTWLLYLTFGGFSIYFATLLLVLCDGRSLVDYIGKTKLISLLDSDEEQPKESPRENSRNSDEYIDAKFTEVPKEDTSSDKDDEYTVF